MGRGFISPHPIGPSPWSLDSLRNKPFVLHSLSYYFNKSTTILSYTRRHDGKHTKINPFTATQEGILQSLSAMAFPTSGGGERERIPASRVGVRIVQSH
jgi:hypothetical protein